MNSEKILEVHNLKTVFKSRDYRVEAVRGVDFSVEKGDILGIVGESGSGKSVTMKSVLGILPENADVSADKILFNNKNLTEIDAESYRKLRGKEMTMIFQDPLTALNPLLKVGKQLEELAKEEGVDFVHGKGKKKSDIQRLSELFMDYKNKLVEYKNSLGIMTNTRHSYSKTDTEATFMRMKEDHMRNGQLKPAYNLQFASENHYIIHALVSQDRTDYSSLEQIVELHNQSLDTKLDKVIADSGYASEHNLSLLEEENIRPFIKLQNHEQKKKRSYKEDIGKYYNMKKINVRNAKGKLITAYVCHDNRILEEIKEEVRIVKGEERVYKVFQSASCEGCLYKEDCLYNYNKDTDVEKNKILRVNERYQKLKEQSEQNILSDEGIIDRQIRSIMAEGYFGDMKGNRKYRRFHFRGLEKINKEILLYVIGINLMKYYRFSKGLLKKLELKVA